MVLTTENRQTIQIGDIPVEVVQKDIWKFYKEMLNRLPVRHEQWDHYPNPPNN
ncbi:MAG: hypothetical protein HC934_04495 [Acaryochloridaceae cyanobacterium SU_2_1]|nr:hypothetical protein [Acaryochloridaceae cyanobacterium SU_2_1]